MRSEGFANLLLPYAEAAATRELTSISNFLQRRQIKWMFHFTHFSNLESIIENGILSREKLSSKDLLFEPTDQDRADGLLGGISLSLSFPNRWMLKRKVESIGNYFVVIEISANALLNKSIISFPSNAARREFEELVPNMPENYVGVRGLSNLFLNDEIRLRNKLMVNIPTDMQSEIMVFEAIESHSIRGIHIPADAPQELIAKVQAINDQREILGVDYPCKHSFFDFSTSGYSPHDGRRWDSEWK